MKAKTIMRGGMMTMKAIKAVRVRAIRGGGRGAKTLEIVIQKLKSLLSNCISGLQQMLQNFQISLW